MKINKPNLILGIAGIVFFALCMIFPPIYVICGLFVLLYIWAYVIQRGQNQKDKLKD